MSNINDVCLLFIIDFISNITFCVFLMSIKDQIQNKKKVKININDYMGQDGKVLKEKEEEFGQVIVLLFLNSNLYFILIAPLIEEILYRCIPYHILPTKIFIFVSIIGFAFTHFFNYKSINLIIKESIYEKNKILYTFFALINGIIFHICYIQTNIICSIILHLFHNLTSIFFIEKLENYLEQKKD